MSAAAASDNNENKPRAVDTNERPEKENGSDFQQQKLSHFYAQHNPPSTIICMFIVAIAFIPVGSAIIVASDSLFEKNVRYDDINKYQAGKCNHNLVTWTSGALSASGGCRARPTFTLSSKVKGPIYMYYRLKGFYQNYRPYAKSISDSQLQGEQVTRTYIEDCWPFVGPGQYKGSLSTQLNSSTDDQTTYGNMQYSPCGAVPWSMFNDSIALWKVSSESSVSGLAPGASMPADATLICDGGSFASNGTYVGAYGSNNSCTKTGIAFEADTETRFKDPHKASNVWTGEGKAESTNDYQKAGWYADEIGHKIPINTDEDFMVWTRIAGLSDFRKLYRRIDTDLEAGTYALDVIEHYDTTSFDGEKHIVFATETWVGGRNLVLGGLFVMFGAVCMVMAIIFLIYYVVSGPQRKEELEQQRQQQQRRPTSAVADQAANNNN